MTVLVAGLLLSHYFAALLFLVFLAFSIGQSLIEDFQTGQGSKRKNWLPLIIGGSWINPGRSMAVPHVRSCSR
jgi:hypothetical protein